jgi:ABC-2 type transport system ATP-binding protein
VTSHLLGELERISDHVVIVDAGRLLRASSTADQVQVTQVLAVEVTDDGDGTPGPRLESALAGHGLVVRGDGPRLEVDIVVESTYDVVRDAVAGLGLGLVRLQQRRHRMEEVFRDDDQTTVAAGGDGRTA